MSNWYSYDADGNVTGWVSDKPPNDFTGLIIFFLILCMFGGCFSC